MCAKKQAWLFKNTNVRASQLKTKSSKWSYSSDFSTIKIIINYSSAAPAVFEVSCVVDWWTGTNRQTGDCSRFGLGHGQPYLNSKKRPQMLSRPSAKLPQCVSCYLCCVLNETPSTVPERGQRSAERENRCLPPIQSLFKVKIHLKQFQSSPLLLYVYYYYHRNYH